MVGDNEEDDDMLREEQVEVVVGLAEEAVNAWEFESTAVLSTARVRRRKDCERILSMVEGCSGMGPLQRTDDCIL